eukprot:TRINITY_DN786_c0_g1_i8.p1 TRINITY_DN786_c0_g1~~TRINITY_DN786_c0_g1_i8.p1  ORF type:complete len:525 (+),score=113.49 TRINITY_DN786_c0_g1_i8:457-2031(+)
MNQQEANKLGLKTILFDFVDPSTQGTTWGLGGTCVNVGCIPKKLMHQASLHGENVLATRDYGWNFGKLNDPMIEDDEELHKNFISHFKWEKLVQSVQTYIKSLNFGFRSELREVGIPYVNAMAAFWDKNTLIYTNKKADLQKAFESNQIDDSLGKITADNIIIATGGRPTFLTDEMCLNCAKYAISSDDLFSLKKPPGKTLVLGGGYIGIECAGFLAGLGFPVTLMNRSRPLRIYDKDCSDVVLNYMKEIQKIEIIPNALPYEIQKNEETGKLLIKWRESGDGPERQEEFDTFLVAIGRTANTRSLNLERAGVVINERNLKVKGGYNNEFEQTSVSNIYALGDVLDQAPELTPVAIKSGRFLAHRIAERRKNPDAKMEDMKKYLMNYEQIPTTIFSPIEYGFVGLSEEEARKKYGDENIECYHSTFTPLEESVLTRMNKEAMYIRKKSYAKLVVNKLDDERVLGVHFVGPNAGEVIQGYAVALRANVTKRVFDDTIGIHPTTSEEFTLMRITKSSGESSEKTSC